MTTGFSSQPRLDLRLVAVHYGACDANLYEFARPDGGVLPAADPGAHIGLILPNGAERQYSLIYPSVTPTSYVVAVKKDANSRGGSHHIHDQLRVGTMLEVLPPRNNFPLDETAAHSVLIAGGIGVTPIYCMAQRLAQLGRSFEFHYACRSRQDAALLSAIEAMPSAHVHFDEEHAGQPLAMAEIAAAAPAGADLYCCGPGPMLAAFEAACAGRPPGKVHVEYFTAREAAATDGGFTVSLTRSGLEVKMAQGQSILQAVIAVGIDVPFSCEEGVCGACETGVVSGVPDHRDAILSPQERIDNKTMMICCSGSKTDRLVLDL